MGTKDDKYLVLRGKNKDIYFIQKRVSKKISSIIGKEFIKKSLETSDILIAREKRDTILEDLKEIELKHSNKNVPINTDLIDITQALNHLVDKEDVPIEANLKTHEYKNKDLSTKNESDQQNVPILPRYKTSDSEYEYKKHDLSTKNDSDQQNVPIEEGSDKENNNKDGYLSFIDYSKLPKKEDILSFVDKITPLAIVFLVIFVSFLV
jgi:hypothetical protein